MKYVHIDTHIKQKPYKTGHACGDVVEFRRNASYTLLAVCDGIGHGIRANVAANMCCSRILELMKRGFSLRRAFSHVVKSMNDVSIRDRVYSAFSVARILNDGEATVLTYEMPAPIFVGTHKSRVLLHRKFTLGKESISESNCFLQPGEGLLIVSDGITNAGMGMHMKNGWSINGVEKYITDKLQICKEDIPKCLMEKSDELLGKAVPDDRTAAFLLCRKGKIVNIFTGPPEHKKDDYRLVKKFLNQEGKKIVCGGKSADIVSKITDEKIYINHKSGSSIAPPSYYINGIDLVTEGSVTLNQVYHILDEDTSKYEIDTGVTQLSLLLREADRINFFLGRASNIEEREIRFIQRGISPKLIIVPMIKKKLEDMGKLVVIEEY